MEYVISAISLNYWKCFDYLGSLLVLSVAVLADPCEQFEWLLLDSVLPTVVAAALLAQQDLPDAAAFLQQVEAVLFSVHAGCEVVPALSTDTLG